MQTPSGGPVSNNQTGSGPWNPTRQQLDQLETILQKMIKNPGTGDPSGGQLVMPTPYWAGSPANPTNTVNNWSTPQNPGPQSHQSPKPPETIQTLPLGGWNPSQNTWGPLAETWRNQQAPLSQPVSTNPSWAPPQTTNNSPPAASPTTPSPISALQPTRPGMEDYGETGISWLLNAIIDLPLQFIGPPGRFLMSWGGRYMLGFLGITMLAYSGILVASDWMEWPWADRLIPSNLIHNFLNKAG